MRKSIIVMIYLKFIWYFFSGEGAEVEFDLLHILSFDSTRKRMSVIVKHPMTKEIILLTKGADSQVLSVLDKKYKGKHHPSPFNCQIEEVGFWLFFLEKMN